jgi:hypothetical protein
MTGPRSPPDGRARHKPRRPTKSPKTDQEPEDLQDHEGIRMDAASPAPHVADTLEDPDPHIADTLQQPDLGATRIPEEPDPDDAGQTTAEYALVLLGAAAIAAILIKWATSSSGLVKLFTAVIRKLVQGVAG